MNKCMFFNSWLRVWGYIREKKIIFNLRCMEMGKYLSNLGMTQLRIAETEKYAHVTFFLNGGIGLY
jgi:bisphosphoglycerate-independent phosphoglycerate mutase (AlkP superfamily)